MCVKLTEWEIMNFCVMITTEGWQENANDYQARETSVKTVKKESLWIIREELRARLHG